MHPAKVRSGCRVVNAALFLRRRHRGDPHGTRPRPVGCQLRSAAGRDPGVAGWTCTCRWSTPSPAPGGPPLARSCRLRMLRPTLPPEHWRGSTGTVGGNPSLLQREGQAGARRGRGGQVPIGSPGPRRLPPQLETVADLLAVIRQTPATVSHAGTPAWLARVKDQLDDSGSHTIRLGRIAMEAGVDAVTLCRAFPLAYACVPSAYLRQRRIGRAAAAIAAGAGSLSSIAFQSGFADQSHLTHVFRRLTGMTPGQYRPVISPRSGLTAQAPGGGRESAAGPGEARQR